jgi:hypothetical protein
MSDRGPQTPGDRMGLIEKLLEIIKGLTITNIVTLAMLIGLLLPAYLGWRVINDATLMALILSEYRELPAKTDCQLAKEQPAGTEGTYSLRTPFAERSREVWYISVRVRFEPDEQALNKYCAALQGVVDYLSDPQDTPVPVFPDSTRRIIRTGWGRPGTLEKP